MGISRIAGGSTFGSQSRSSISRMAPYFFAARRDAQYAFIRWATAFRCAADIGLPFRPAHQRHFSFGWD